MRENSDGYRKIERTVGGSLEILMVPLLASQARDPGGDESVDRPSRPQCIGLSPNRFSYIMYFVRRISFTYRSSAVAPPASTG